MEYYAAFSDFILGFLRKANEYGIWELLSTLALIVGLKWLFFKRRKIPHFNIHYERARDTSNYPLKIKIELRNFTGCPCVISFPFVELKTLRADTKARGNSFSKQYEVKFHNGGAWHIDTFLRHGEYASTWVPLDPMHTDLEVDAALAKGEAGHIEFTCVWLRDRPIQETVRTPIIRS